MILIVDDEEPIRDALTWLLKSCGYASRTFGSVADFLAAFPQLSRPVELPVEEGCIILDIRMPKVSGTEFFERLHSKGWHEIWPVIFLTGHGDVPMAVDALKSGAFDFIEKPFSDNILVSSVKAALTASASAIDRGHNDSVLQTGLAQLTPRERDVMQLIIDGHYNKVVAEKLGISMRTVEVYRSRVFQKLGVRSAVELVSLLQEGKRK